MSEDEEFMKIQGDIAWDYAESVVVEFLNTLKKMQILDEASRIATVVGTGTMLIGLAFDECRNLGQPQVIPQTLEETISKITKYANKKAD